MSNLIAVGDLEGYVHFLTRDEGKFAARIKLDSNPVMSLIAGKSISQVIAATRDGGLYAISVAENNSKPAAEEKPSEKATDKPAANKPVATEPASEKNTESSAEPITEASPAPSTEPSTERSILFQKNDSILSPDSNSDTNSDTNSAPGIRLPSPEQQ